MSDRPIDRHRIIFHHDDDGYGMFRVECPYDRTNEHRPCWPWDTERDEPERLPAPQPDCTYQSWVEALDHDEVRIGPFSVAFPITEVEWEGDGTPTFMVGSGYAYHEPTNQLPEGS